MRATLVAVLIICVGIAPGLAAEVDYRSLPVERLIDDLQLVDAEGPGLESTATVEGFIGDDSPLTFSSGVIGSPAPVVAPQMRELVRRGPEALPALVRHLNDRRETKLKIGQDPSANPIGLAFFGGQYFGSEYAPKTIARRQFDPNAFNLGTSFTNQYTLKVGDICYSLIGQIVNRALSAVRYQPTAILIVNSPVQTPGLAAKVKADWGGATATDLRESLLADLHGPYDSLYEPALVRLRIYFPEVYAGLTGLDSKKRAAFEFASKKAIAEANDQTDHSGDPEVAFTRGMKDCASLEACLNAFDANIHASRNAYDDYEIAIAEVAGDFERFGDAAKAALLARTTDPDDTWRFRAGDVLAHWVNLSEADQEPLLEAYQMQGGLGAAKPLAKIGSARALQALAAHLEIYGDGDVTTEALADAGPKALPYLLPILSNEDVAEGAVAVIEKMGAGDGTIAAEWGAVAADTGQPKARRIGALRGLAAMKTNALPAGDVVATLVIGRDAMITKAANDALTAMGYRSVVDHDVTACNPLADPFSSSRGADGGCLGKIAAYGANATQFGNLIADKFLSSSNGSDRADGATALGYVGYGVAIPRLIALLHDRDWRAVYAAERALGWLGAKDAVPALQEVASSHWLPAVRDEATQVVSAIGGPNGRLTKRPMSTGSSIDDIFAPNPNIANAAYPLPPEVTAALAKLPPGTKLPPGFDPTGGCVSGIWSWQGMEFRKSPDQLSLAIAAEAGTPAGRIVGSFVRPDGGSLEWKADDGTSDLLRASGVRSLAAGSSGPMALLGETARFRYSSAPNNQAEYLGQGLAGNAYVVQLTRDAMAKWRLSEVARLPLGADALATIGPDLFAAWSGRSVVVFTPQGILGLAQCVAGK